MGAAARLLRSFYPLITPAGQSGLASSLGNSADRLPSGTRCPDPALPFIRLHSFPMLPSQMDIIKRNPAKRSGGQVQLLQGHLSTRLSPSFNLIVKSIHLSVHSDNFDAFPVSLSLPPNTAKVILLSGIPTKAGTLSISGCIVHCFGVITEHLFLDVDHLLLGAAHGLVLSDPFRCCGSGKSRHVNIPRILVLPPMPLLVSHAVEDNNASTLFEGEIRDIWVRLRNAGTVPVEQAHLSLAGKNQNSVISIAHGTLSLALPLNPGAEVTFPVTVKAWKLNSAGSDHDGKKSISESLRSASTEGSNPLLVIHYAGSSSHHQENSEPSLLPGRRLVLPLQICVLQGLHFVQARLLPMEVPSHVDNFAQIDPHGLSRLLHLLELELSNPTNVTFEVYVSIETEHSIDPQNTIFPKTRIDPGCISHVLIPLQHLKLLVVDDGFFAITNDALGGKVSHLIERNLMAELAASVTKFISKWKLTKMATQEEASVSEARFGSSISVHEMTDIDVVIRNNTRR
ncbi:hypothetical protein HPP92_024454 [Vanilla planifolia]|uniref:Trs120/TRAPPC9 first Ig-like domain-containing protein n=1 Tax=Vanilla planifolia TaxID=51239 RepID=A0A835PMF1_VANPL|nr:hypothetical protein HPP92_024454 [Vanilla planifolia]